MGVSSDIEATVAALDGLHAAKRARDAVTFGQLQAVVANLDAVVPPMQDDYPEPELHQRRPDDPRQPAPREGEGFGEVSISRPKDFHPFGPAVKSKLIAEAMAKGDW